MLFRSAITPDPEPGRDERRGRVRQGLAAKVFGTLGRVLIATGIVVLLFAAYQLWGTGLSEARAQGDLADEFARSLAAAPSAGPGGSAASSNSSAPDGGRPTAPADATGERTIEDLLELGSRAREEILGARLVGAVVPSRIVVVVDRLYESCQNVVRRAAHDFRTEIRTFGGQSIIASLFRGRDHDAIEIQEVGEPGREPA